MTMYFLCAVLGHLAGFVMGLWWTRPDVQRLNAKIRQLETENQRLRKYVLRNFKMRVWRNGVEVDPDDA